MSTKNRYNQLKDRYNTTNPKGVDGVGNTSYFYYENKLFNMIYSTVKFDNLPELWDEEYIKEAIFRNKGLVVATETSAGLAALESGYSGYNILGRPTDFIITNAVLGTLQGKMGVDGYPLYIGIRNNRYITTRALVNRYAQLLATVDGSINTTLLNSRVSLVFNVSSDAQAQSALYMYDKVSQGEPVVVVRQIGDETLDPVLFNNVKNTYVGNDLLLTKRTILNEFMSEIGINNNDVLKKERLISDEANSNLGELNSNITSWMDNLKKCINDINNAYGLSITVDFNHDVVGIIDKHIKDTEGEDEVQFD